MESIGWTHDNIAKKLKDSYGYGEDSAVRVATQILTAQPEIQAQIQRFFNGQKITLDKKVEEFDLNRLMDQGLNEIAALLTMNWLIVDPQKALPIVRKGYDRISV